MGMQDAERYPAETLDQWHDWLARNHATSTGVWLVSWRPATGRPRLDYDASIREALCWGWIDGQSKPLDDQRTMLWFAPRRPTSTWAGTNKARVAELIAQGRMQPAGLAAIDLAKANGMWTVLDGPEALIVPDDLRIRLDADPVLATEWERCPKSVRKQALGAIALAKRPETRAARIEAIITKLANGERPA